MEQARVADASLPSVGSSHQSCDAPFAVFQFDTAASLNVELGPWSDEQRIVLISEDLWPAAPRTSPAKALPGQSLARENL